MRRRALAGCAAVVVALSVWSIPVAHAAPGTSGGSAQDWETRELIGAYLRDYPGMTTQQASRAVHGQIQRIRLLERLQAEDPAGFGGSWYEPRTDIQHINAVGATAAARSRQLGAELGLTVAAHPASRSLTDLMVLADEINAGRHPAIGAAGAVRATPDPVGNQVRVGPAAPASAAVPELCTDRLHCGSPLRSGVVIWCQWRSGADPRCNQSGGRGNVCSLGYTARASDGSRWAVTAGHCGALTGENGAWGHGEQPIGPIRHGRNSSNIDVARILVANAYWQTGGWFFNGSVPNTPVPVDYAIAARGTIQVGDGVCLSAWHSTVGHACGTIVDAFDPARGMPQVSFDACPGDSGGGWYHLTGGQRWAYGIHHGQPPGTVSTCHDHARNDSIFTAVPDLNAWWDSTTSATLRIESR